jgi:hypothetical protein
MGLPAVAAEDIIRMNSIGDTTRIWSILRRTKLSLVMKTGADRARSGAARTFATFTAFTFASAFAFAFAFAITRPVAIVGVAHCAAAARPDAIVGVITIAAPVAVRGTS